MTKRILLFSFAAVAAAALLLVNSHADKPSDGKWLQLFNGKDLSGWTPKIRYQKAGEDPKKTFRVEDGAIKVSYENYDEFKETFGHLFYETPYSNYRLRVEYRFTGEQLEGGPGWATRNSGLMLAANSRASVWMNCHVWSPRSVTVLGWVGDCALYSAAIRLPLSASS